MNQTVVAAYGWQGLDFGHGFHKTKQGIRFTISETARCEMLDLLLELNHKRYDDEVAQCLHEKGKKKGKTTNRKTRINLDEGQMSLI
jgi:predicted DNA-binding WGR domain protein